MSIYWFVKGFDTVDHSILLKKLRLYCITDKNLALFESYLSNRKQYVHIVLSSKAHIKYVTCGVPQASILRPFLFSVFVNNIQNVSHLLDLFMFADDMFWYAYDMPFLICRWYFFSLIIRILKNSLQLQKKS